MRNFKTREATEITEINGYYEASTDPLHQAFHQYQMEAQGMSIGGFRSPIGSMVGRRRGQEMELLPGVSCDEDGHTE